MSLDAMKQALEALEQYTNVVTSVNDPNSWVTVLDGGKPARDAITALRAAIEQAERPWQVLTDEQLETMAEKYVTNCYFDTLKFARAIEAKLKEKNDVSRKLEAG